MLAIRAPAGGLTRRFAYPLPLAPLTPVRGRLVRPEEFTDSPSLGSADLNVPAGGDKQRIFAQDGTRFLRVEQVMSNKPLKATRLTTEIPWTAEIVVQLSFARTSYSKSHDGGKHKSRPGFGFAQSYSVGFSAYKEDEETFRDSATEAQVSPAFTLYFFPTGHIFEGA